jgi:hypothetical protein
MKSALHRASVFVLNSKNEIMLQQRAHQKYHSPLLGLIPVAVIKGKGRVIRLVVEDYLKKWF